MSLVSITAVEATLNQGKLMMKPKERADFLKALMVHQAQEDSTQFTFRFGKHKGKTMREVVQTDMGYLDWLLAQDDGVKFQDVMTLIRSIKGDTMEM